MGGIRMKKIGLQLYSVQEAVQLDLLATLEAVAEMGYSAVQFASFANQPAKVVKEKLIELDLQVAGAHIQENIFEANIDDILRYHDAIDNHLLIVPWLPENMRSTIDDYTRTAEKLDTIGKKLSERGFKLGYHNHDFEFQVFDGRTGLDILFQHSDASHLKLELDCFWAAYTNNHPIDVMDKYKNRCVSLHIKDLKLEEGLPISTEIGTGTLPLKDYIKKGMEIGVTNVIVEQEHFIKPPLDSAKNNIKAMLEIKASL